MKVETLSNGDMLHIILKLVLLAFQIWSNLETYFLTWLSLCDDRSHFYIAFGVAHCWDIQHHGLFSGEQINHVLSLITHFEKHTIALLVLYFDLCHKLWHLKFNCCFHLSYRTRQWCAVYCQSSWRNSRNNTQNIQVREQL